MLNGIVKIGNWKLLGKNTIGLTFFPFIFIQKSWADQMTEDSINVAINHEKIHIKQQLELAIFLFYFWYFLEFLIRFLQTRNFTKAYREISLEKEAYHYQSDLNFLSERKSWNFLRFLP